MGKSDSRPSVIDLFSGVGGLSLGAARAGFRVAASVEFDPIASKSHTDNFPATVHLEEDVGLLTGAELLSAAKLAKGQLDGLVGGPPCQGFSPMGRGNKDDPRNDLFRHFFRLVEETRPAFYLAENVPGILAERARDVLHRAQALLPKTYVALPPIRVEAQRFGAPTTRTRVFFIGYDRDRVDNLGEAHFAPPESIDVVTVRDALAGLPGVRSNWQDEAQSWRRVSELPSTEFAKRVVDMVPPGVGMAAALARMRAKGEVSGFLGTKHSQETIARFSRLKPGQIDTVYRAPRLKLAGFCPTLRAGTGKDKGSYQAVRPIHPTSDRVITPREGARLQGFPDWFVFHATKWHSFRQIGNSVSPIVAEALLKKLFAASA